MITSFRKEIDFKGVTFEKKHLIRFQTISKPQSMKLLITAFLLIFNFILAAQSTQFAGDYTRSL
ncbi:hypothetical protein BSF42_21500 [Flavobacterium sp. ACN6]|nr:hypothetical protein BSF42_21500 [Flavobacterium sp. ACN6]